MLMLHCLLALWKDKHINMIRMLGNDDDESAKIYIFIVCLQVYPISSLKKDVVHANL